MDGRERADRRLMGLAIALGRRNLGRTWPNPSVGAVLAGRDGRIIATGITQPGGRPHAERVALEAAGAVARGATLYVSLEPCSHWGRTPPCVDAVIAAGIGRLVSAITDPNPAVAGRGHARARASGLAVTTDVGHAEAARAHRGHIRRVTDGRPSVTLKLARTPDGFAGRRGGDRLVITGAVEAARVHLARAHADAVMVGVDTVLADDPRLDVRLPGLEDRSPLRVVLDSRLRMPLASHIVRTAKSRPTWVVTSAAADATAEARLTDAGLVVIRVTPDANGRADLAQALAALGERGLTHIFCEGGPTLAEALAAADLIDDCVLATGPTALGSPSGAVPAVGPHLRRLLADNLVLVADERFGTDRVTFHARTS